jgi:hypothetical protein
MLGIRVIHLQEDKPASPLHWPWIKNRHVRDIVALIDARPAQAQRLSSNPAITPAPVTAGAAAPSGGAAFSSTDGGEAVQPTVQRPINSRRVDQAPELHTLFFLRRVPLESWKGRWRFGIAWIGDDVMDLLVANSKAIRSGDRIIVAMVSSDASGR